MGQDSSKQYRPLHNDVIELTEPFEAAREDEDRHEKDIDDTDQLLSHSKSLMISTTGKESKSIRFRLSGLYSVNSKKRRCLRCLLFSGSLALAIAAIIGFVLLLPCKDTPPASPAQADTTSHLNDSSTSAAVSHATLPAAVNDTINVSTIGAAVSVTSPPYVEPRLLHWRTGKSGLGTEGPIRLLDVNNDGTWDVIVSYMSGAANSAMLKLMKGKGSLESGLSNLKRCVKNHNPGVFDYCGGGVAAFDGGTGQLLWYSPAYMEVFALKCGGIDVNRDGQEDCLAAGRVGVLYAIDTRDGHIMWEGDRQAINTSWNVFTPALVGDLDGDGIDEVLIANGGNQQYSPFKKDRDAGQLLVLRGNSGKSIGRGFHMPDGHETYMSPVILKLPDGTKIVLFGSGGETVGGALWAIRLVDLICYMTDMKSNLPLVNCSTTNHQNWEWGGHQADLTAHGVPLHKLVNSIQRGVMVPPVLVDLNRDTVSEIVGYTFDGYAFAINGASREIIWEKDMPGTQSYSSPAPAMFNDDDIPDIMLQVVTGDWSANNYSMTNSIIVDGTNGQILWSMKTRRQMMASPLSLAQSSSEHGGWFVFWVSGRVSWPGSELTSFLPGASGGIASLKKSTFVSMEEVMHEVDTQPDDIDPWIKKGTVSVVKSGNQEKRHSDKENEDFDHEDEKNYKEDLKKLLHSAKPADYDDVKDSAKCGVDENIFTTELFAVNSDHALSPVKIAEALSFSGEKGTNSISKRHESPDLMNVCNQFRPSIRSTFAVGDLNGDGLIEVAMIKSWSSYVLVDSSYSHMEFYTSFEVLTVHLNATDGGDGIFLPIHNQPWAGYMGTRADSSYSK